MIADQSEVTNPLAKLGNTTRALAEAKSLDDIRQIRDIAEAARTYARAAEMGIEAQNHAAEIKLRAERKAGEFLAEMELSKGSQGQLNGNPNFGGRIVEPPKNDTPTLTDLGINKSQSSRWQTIATLP